jgi:predicted GIY-YIG superfamily endonuclease
MPFNQFTPRSFTSGAVQMYAPDMSGVYGISNAREWIYIGETDNIQSSLLSHLHEINTSLMKREPTGFVFEVCAQAHRASRQDRLVSEYGPACNRLEPQQS